jgi:ribosomal protein S18 acetylase RimI-like enzyme
MSEFTIRPYAHNDEDATKLAVMWNESDDQWPGTFTGGVPMTAERMRDWLDREKGLAILVVDDPSEERIVGYGSLWEERDKENLCYVAVLNVHPAYQRKSLARRMLTQMIDQAVELGYHQMNIETWPGNLKSVPLYKKVGFFWVPDTNVHMENFIPLIRQMPVAQIFFQKHDWYTTFKRELLQIEDDERRGAMKVYGYHWEEDGEEFSIWIDREAKAPMGVEITELAAYAELDDINPALGLSYPIRWRVVNKRNEPVNVAVIANGDPGIQISHQSAFLLNGGEERVVEGRFTVSPTIKPVKKDRPAHRIRTVLVIGDQAVELSTGVRSRPPLEISTEPAIPVLLPSQPSTIHVQLRNRLDRPLHGVISLAPAPGLSVDWEGMSREFDLDAQGYAGFPLAATCTLSDAVPLRFNADLQIEEETIPTRSVRIPLLGLRPGGIVGDIGESNDQGNEIVVENEFYRLHCRTEGGRCALLDKINNRPVASIREELGPPFVPSELWYKAYDLALERGAGGLTARLCARSDNFPGLVLIKELVMSASPLITLRYYLTNEGTRTHVVQLNPRIWMGEREKAQLTLPRAERLVQERAAQFSSTHGDIPEMPTGMAEQWLAWRIDDFTLGLIWDEDIEKHSWDWSVVSFDRKSLTLEPGSSTEVPPIHVYAGPGDWADVQRTWQRLAGQERSRRSQVKPRRELEIGFGSSPLMCTGDQVNATLRAETLRKVALNGRLVIEPPDGWSVQPAEFTLDDIKHGHALAEPVQLVARSEDPGAFTGALRLEGSRFDITKSFTLIRLGDAKFPVQIEESKTGKHTVFALDNGRNRWEIVPGYHAGVVSWHSSDRETNQLRCAYPQAGGAAMGWLKPWFGGIQPILNPDEIEQDGWPGKLHEEVFAHEQCTCIDERGVNWQGLCLSAQLEREAFRGLKAEIEYLTLGGSHMLRVVYRLVNPTDVYWHVVPGILTFCQVDGRYDNATLHSEGLQQKRTPTMAWTVVDPWGAVTNPVSNHTMVMVKGTRSSALELSDWGQDGGHLICQQRTTIPPHSSREMIVFLALTDSLSAAQRYAAMSQ